MVGSQEEAAEARKVGYRANLVKTTKREQNPVVVKMLLRELSKDADLLALRVKRIRGERVHELERSSQSAPYSKKERSAC